MPRTVPSPVRTSAPGASVNQPAADTLSPQSVRGSDSDVVVEGLTPRSTNGSPAQVETPAPKAAPAPSPCSTPVVDVPKPGGNGGIQHKLSCPETSVAEANATEQEAAGIPTGEAPLSDLDGEPFGDDDIPDIANDSAPRFKKGEHHLSENAIRCRARRIFTPRVDGSLKVSETIFAEWRSKGQPRKNLEQIFKQCGYDAEAYNEISTCIV